MNHNSQDFIGHLEELRKRLMVTLFSFLLAFAFCFIFVKDVYRFLVRDLDHKLAILGPSDVVWVYFMIAGVGAIALTIPVAAYHIWRFVKPALREREQKATVMFIPALTLLFLVGISFGYFIIYPMVLGFLNSMSGDFETMYTAERYFTFMIHMTLPFGLLFEMPAVSYVSDQAGDRKSNAPRQDEEAGLLHSCYSSHYHHSARHHVGHSRHSPPLCFV